MRRAIVIATVWIAGCHTAEVPVDAFAPDARAMDAAPPLRDAARLFDGPPRLEASVPFEDVSLLPPDTGLACFATCAADVDCIAACGSVPGGGWRCCDLPTARCYVSHATGGCFSPFLDSGVDATVDAPCPTMPAAGSIDLSAPSLPFATLRIPNYAIPGWGTQTSLDENGHIDLDSGPLPLTPRSSQTLTVTEPAFGQPLVLNLVAATGIQADFGIEGELPDAHAGTASHVTAVVHREIATGECVLSVISVEQDCATRAAVYDPSLFDDAPCGPYRAPDGRMDAGGACVPFCTLDSECAATCATSPLLVACCDRSTQQCYQAIGPSCPSPFVDAGVDAAADAACWVMPATTRLVITAPGLGGVFITYFDPVFGTTQTTLDANGSGTLQVRALSVMIDVSGRSRLVTPDTQTPITLHAMRGTIDVPLTITTQIVGASEVRVSEVEIAIESERSMGACVASITSATLGCAPHAGLYDPTRFDDVACGAFR